MKNTKLLILNALIAAIYVALSISLAAVSFGAIQFRLAETLNHLYLFNKKLIYGILLGVAIANYFSFDLIDVLIGPLASFIAFLGTMLLTKNVNNIYYKMIINTFCSSIAMIFIALELHFLFNAPFIITFFTMFFSELIMMSIGIFIFGSLKDNHIFIKNICE